MLLLHCRPGGERTPIGKEKDAGGGGKSQVKRLGDKTKNKKSLDFLFHSAYVLSSGLSLAMFASSGTLLLKTFMNVLKGCPNLNKILCFLHI